MRDLDEVMAALRASSRSRLGLDAKDLAYLRAKGLDTVLEHARDFVEKRLAPARPAKDGKQTPWRGHPAFVAQHATGTCCRTCLERWHRIERGRELGEEEKQYVVRVMREWLLPYLRHGGREP